MPSEDKVTANFKSSVQDSEKNFSSIVSEEVWMRDEFVSVSMVSEKLPDNTEENASHFPIWSI